MKNHSLVLTQTGVYFFRAPTKLTLFLGRELLVVLSSPLSQACGLLLFDIDSPVRNLEDSLDRLLAKMSLELKLKTGDLQGKLFGMAHYRESVVTTVKRWLEKNELRLVTTDTGRNARREIFIDCSVTRVGVKYATENAAGTPEFLAVGSARKRYGGEVPTARVLVLSGNPVKRVLAQQAVEEQPGAIATTPEDPKKFLVGKEFKGSSFTHILIFDDLNGVTALKSFLKKAKTQIPGANWYWIGKEPPDSSLFRPLPRLTPEQLMPFKIELAKALESMPTPVPADTTQVISFPKPKRKRTG